MDGGQLGDYWLRGGWFSGGQLVGGMACRSVAGLGVAWRAVPWCDMLLLGSFAMIWRTVP